MALKFSDLYNAAARWAGDTSTDGVARSKDAVAEGNRLLSYGAQLPLLRPWWRKREDSVTAVAGTAAYALPTAQGTFESLNTVWYRSNGRRYEIPIVDDDVWQEEVNENTANTGTPDICNLHKSSGTVQLRFNPMPSSAFVNQVDGSLIRMDGWIEETLTASSGDTVEPLMPDSRRWGIIWKAVEMLGILQGDQSLVLFAAGQGKRYYELLLADDIGRVGDEPRIIRPIEAVGDMRAGDRLLDYGHG